MYHDTSDWVDIEATLTYLMGEAGTWDFTDDTVLTGLNTDYEFRNTWFLNTYEGTWWVQTYASTPADFNYSPNTVMYK